MDLKQYSLPIAIIIAGVLFSAATLYSSKGASAPPAGAPAGGATSALEQAVLPPEGVVLPVSWGNLGTKLLAAGAIDESKFKELYGTNWSEEYGRLLTGQNNGKMSITPQNAAYLLNLFWALGLANKNPVLEDKTEMMNPSYGGAGNFASTAGWTISSGDAMSHYGMHALVPLTPGQQMMVERVARGIYRPCCGNSTHFPDCNHGMAMLGLLELLASQGASEAEMYKTALAVNSYWFPDTYLTIATYMQQKGIAWKDVSPAQVLGADYSSGPGFQNMVSQMAETPSRSSGGGGCSV